MYACSGRAAVSRRDALVSAATRPAFSTLAARTETPASLAITAMVTRGHSLCGLYPDTRDVCTRTVTELRHCCKRAPLGHV